MKKLPLYLIFSGFILGIFAPLAGMMLRVGHETESDFIDQENRPPSHLDSSALSVKSLLTDRSPLETAFNDHYSFRRMLISGYALTAWHLFRSPINPQNCQIGQNDYLFLSDNHAQVFSQHAGSVPIPEEILTKTEQHQDALKKWCAQRRIIYLCVVPPDKHSIYPEYLPRWVLTPNQNLFIDKLTDQIKDKDLVLNLKPALLKAKSLQQDKLYPKWDTHWNDLGAFEGYKALMQKLSSLSDTPLKQMESVEYRRKETAKGNDLSKMSKTQGFIKDIAVEFVKNIPREGLSAITYEGEKITPVPFYIKPTDNTLVENKNALNKKTLVIFRDSFSTAWAPLLYATFEKTLFIGADIEPPDLKDWIDENRPDFLVCERVERHTLSQLSSILSQLTTPGMTRKELNAYIQNHIDRTTTLPLAHTEHFTATQCTLSEQENNLVIHTNSSDPFLELPDFQELHASPAREVIVQIDLTTPQHTTTQLFYQTETNNTFQEEYSQRNPHPKGRHILSFYLTANSRITKLRLDPGETAGTYHLHKMTITPVDQKTNQ